MIAGEVMVWSMPVAVPDRSVKMILMPSAARCALGLLRQAAPSHWGLVWWVVKNLQVNTRENLKNGYYHYPGPTLGDQ